MRGRTLKLVFRLFPWHVGALNASRAFNFAAAPWKFARKLAARPTASAERGQKKRGVFAPLDFWFGRAGVTAEGSEHFSAHALCTAAQAPAGSARTRQGTLGSLDSPFAAASSDEPSFRLGA